MNNLINSIRTLIKSKKETIEPSGPQYEFCPRCDANLTLQKGFSSDLPFWDCLGCGKRLIHPLVYAPSDITWICDGCGAMLNAQPGFSDDCGEWKCIGCGYVNKIDASEVYLSEDEYQAELKNPYRGLSDEAVLELSLYEDVEHIGDRENIIVVRRSDNGQKYIKKILSIYDRTVYDYFKDNPVTHMPRIIDLFESSNSLIVIEALIEGSTVEELLEENPLPQEQAVYIARCICRILDDLHSLPTPIIHRDIKPSNIIITPGNEVFLLDMNVAKWYDPDKTDDTRHMGTQYYAAPEQAGYGLSASSAKSDIYELGMLLNVMITRHFPKEKKAPGSVWDIIERCISLEADKRYTAKELIKELDRISEK